MAELQEKVDEIIQLLKEKDSLYQPKCLELIDTLNNLEKKKITSETQLTSILLNFICGNYSLFGFNFDLIDENTMKAIQIILKKIYENTYPNLSTDFDLIKTGKEKINPLLIEYCKQTYKQKQIDFIRKFFSKINYNNLAQYFPKNEIDAIIVNEGWVRVKEYVIPNNKNAAAEFNVGKEIEDVRFINSMNIQLNKLIKEHRNLVTYLNKKS